MLHRPQRQWLTAAAAFSLLVTLVLTASTGRADDRLSDTGRVIVVGGDYHYPPHEFINDQGKPDGYNVAMTRAIARVMGFEAKIVLGPWNELREKLEKGEIDVIQGILKSTEREAYLDFTAPYAIVSQSIFARKEPGQQKKIGLSDLNGHQVLVQQSGYMQEYLRLHTYGIAFIPVESHVDALRLLAAGKYDYAVVAVPLGIYLQKKYHLTNIEPVSEPLSNATYCYAVEKGNTQMLDLFNAGLAILINTGVQQHLYAQWIGEDDRGAAWKSFLHYGAWVLTPLLLVIVGVVIWNNALSRKVAERTHELEERQQQLVQADKLASLGILTSGVAHEINTPNGIILMNLPVLQEAWQDVRTILDDYCEAHGDFTFGGLSYTRLRGDIPTMFADMTDSARRIRQIVNDLKAYTRQEAPGAVSELDLNEVVRNAIRLSDVSLRRATHHARIALAPDLPRIRGNAQRLTQVALNLIVNACQALDGPEKAIEVSTGYDAAGGRVVFKVSDEGIGIQDRDMARLTDPFFTTKRESGGTGLGLSVSLGIVREHGGEITFASVPGRPTLVTVTLPTSDRSTQ